MRLHLPVFASVWRWATLGLLLLSSCVDRYTPQVPATTKSYLVVDGFINTLGVSSFKLSRTLGLAAGTTPLPEAKATAYIGDNAGGRYALTESPAGTYTSARLTLNPSLQYQLRLTTSGGTTYASDLVVAKVTPPIDSVTWKFQQGGVQVSINTHDATNGTTYYRWNFDETWQFASAFYSHQTYDKTRPNGQQYQPRLDNIYNCWASATSTLISLSNTAKLTQDVVSNAPLTFIADNNVRLRYRYSILVQQHAQTQEEYQYWEMLKKNTESIGSLYDALPTQLTGNVHRLDDSLEPVLGYVGAHSVTEQRIFIDRNSLPLPIGWPFDTGYQDCASSIEELSIFDATVRLNQPGFLPVDALYSPLGAIIGYSVAPAGCVDCRLRGTNIKPSFWR